MRSKSKWALFLSFPLVKCLLPFLPSRRQLPRRSSGGGVAWRLCGFPNSRSSCPSGWPGRPASLKSASTVATMRPSVIASVALSDLLRLSVRSATATVAARMAYASCGPSTTRTTYARWTFITTGLIEVISITEPWYLIFIYTYF